jgi:hypothetical protein
MNTRIEETKRSMPLGWAEGDSLRFADVRTDSRILTPLPRLRPGVADRYATWSGKHAAIAPDDSRPLSVPLRVACAVGVVVLLPFHLFHILAGRRP